ncbi:MAG: ABC transporter substrate-binding protein [Nocardioides sp.]|uniref:ABC transporter substrate-binding protein n=1 Tax=Nocardioides sp. TaxID=35761 RepID=UPI003F10C893
MTTRRPAPVRAARRATSLGALALVLAACGTSGGTSSTGSSQAGYSVSVDNCGAEVAFDRSPERAVLLKPGAVPFLADLGILDEVVTARAGAYERAYYDDATWAALERIPVLSDQLDSSGHLQISKEVVLAQRPDLVLGASDNLTRDTLGAVGVPLLEEPALCPTPPEDPTFETVEEQLRTYGKVFAVPDAAEDAVRANRDQLAAILERVPSDEDRTAAVLYPTVDGGTPYAYGTRSMAHPQLEAAGFTNVFADVDERVFEVTVEELVDRDPDVLVLLHSDGDPQTVKNALTTLNGAGALTAVKEDQVLVQLFNFTEPPSPLAIDGLERIVDRFHP